MNITRSLDEKVSSLLGVLPAYEIADFLDDETLIKKIWEMRLKGVGLQLFREGLNVYSTFASFLIGTNPEYFIPLPFVDMGLDVMNYRINKNFEREIGIKIRDKTYRMVMYYDAISSQVMAKGISNGSIFSLDWQINNIELEKINLHYWLLISRPIVQFASITAGKELLPNLEIDLKGSYTLALLGASYGLLPIFSKLGLNDKKLRDLNRILLYEHAKAEMNGDESHQKSIELLQAEYYRKDDKNQIIKFGLRKIVDLALSFASVFKLTNSFYGAARFTSQMLSLPLEYRNFIRSKLEVQENYASTNAMLKILSGEPFLFTNSAWNNYRFEKLKEIEKQKYDKTGIHVDIKTRIPNLREEEYTPRLKFEAETGSIVQLHAGSGAGKSVSLSVGIAGIIQTIGTMYITDKDGKTRCMEEFDREELTKRITYIASSSGYYDMRLADIYQKRFKEIYLEGRKFDEVSSTEKLMMILPDSELEKQIWLISKRIIESGNKKRIDLGNYSNMNKCTLELEGLVPYFEEGDFEKISKYRDAKISYLTEFIQAKGGNFSNVQSYQEVRSLSMGERVRFMLEYSKECTKTLEGGKTRLVILDEPLAHFDSKNALTYLNELKEEISKTDDSVFIIISQDKQNLIDQVFGKTIKNVYFEGQEPKKINPLYLAE